VQETVRILRKGEQLRRNDEYIGKTKFYIQRCRAPPRALHHAVRAVALDWAGYDSTSSTVMDGYCKAVFGLPLEVRRPVFFLAANDELFHATIDPLGRTLDGTLQTRCEETTLTGLLCAQPAFVISSTST